MNAEKLAAHLRIDRYGDFWLTDAVRPSPKVPVKPTEGYRVEVYNDKRNALRVPVLAAAVSREKLFDLFLDMLDPLGEVVDVVLETSHDAEGKNPTHKDLHRERIDLPILKSTFYDFEDLLLHDGCTGIAVLSISKPLEVQFDEHKLLVVYAQDLKPFQRELTNAGVKRDDKMKLITEGEHLHSSDNRYREQFEQFCYRLGVGEAAERVSW
ncbi:MAG TPA: hypothetical protein VE988_01195 [Gemmataceae bacterium]|nr:hypothetical protein [Gemmataceae bacterium]